MTLDSLGPCKTPAINLFPKIFNDFKPFTINVAYKLT